jgi:hypothetical protein
MQDAHVRTQAQKIQASLCFYVTDKDLGFSGSGLPLRDKAMKPAKKKQEFSPVDLFGVYCTCGHTRSAHAGNLCERSCVFCKCLRFIPDLKHPTVLQENQKFNPNE